MRENKYGKVLTIILAIVAVAVLALLGFLGVDVYKKFTTEKAVAEVLGEYENMLNEQSNIETQVENSEEAIPMLNEESITYTNTESGSSKVTYEGYEVIGKIEIPAIDLSYPILERATPSSIELSVAHLYGVQPNEIGNMVIVGHNYRNGSFFGNNDRLQLGDKVYITDNSGTRIAYNIYNIYETSRDDSDYMQRDTNGKREISLSTCTDNSQAVLIIWAVEE